MTSTNCRWDGSDQPRTMPGRHNEDCEGESCAGCQPCTEPHCRLCGISHADGTCPECMAIVRESLHEIARLCDSLPEEVEHRGINGEAMMLLGPSCDPEARGHLEASILAGRVLLDDVATSHTKECEDRKCIGCAGELHPLFVLGSWDAVWRDALEHGEPTERLTIESAVTYLDLQLTYMGAFVHVPFEDFAEDLRRCRAHLESVLHDGEQIDSTRVPCTSEQCHQKARLVVVYGHAESDDHYACPSCKTTYHQQDYARAKLRMLTSAGADKYVRMQDARDAIARPERTWRKWIRYWYVRSYRDPLTAQTWVWWPDVREAEVATPRRRRVA